MAGVVQGVGFRPFVWRTASALGLTGWVSNDARGVVLEAEGDEEALGALARALGADAPGRVERLTAETLPEQGGAGFLVAASRDEGPRRALVAPDLATCEACLAELRDPGDRRHGYAFLCCTACGPRFTVVDALPYDRVRTSLADFPLCASCQAEYDDPADRRFHAQAVVCPACGPRLGALDVAAAGALLRAGKVLAVKGLGGFHLAVDATSEDAVALLRQRKRRPHRPLAVMARDLAAVARLCEVSEQEQALLSGPAAPVVLLTALPGNGLASSVAPGLRRLGVLLPYTPLHHLLLAEAGVPLVMTSGNRSDEPLAFRDDDGARLVSDGIADGLLGHDRPVRHRVDDTVVGVVAGRPAPVRRARGHAPLPLRLPVGSPVPLLACGAELKSTFCLVRDDEAFLSGHVGDLSGLATWQRYVAEVAELAALLEVRPAVVVHDLHPDYAATRYALAQDGVEAMGVQHHHAHVASCLAEHGLAGPVIGLALDGTGYGDDGTSWGGEVLVADLLGYRRVAHLAPVAQPGGDMAVRQPWRMAMSHLDAAFDGAPPQLPVQQRQGHRWEQVRAAARAGVNAPATTSAGRLFDAVAAMLDVRDEVTYEGQAAVELEQVADPAEPGTYPLPLVAGVLDVGVLVRALVADLLAGADRARVAARFHRALADGLTACCLTVREATGLSDVALSGGVFQNALLTVSCRERLERQGFRVLTQEQVPCNDGGISLGQAAVAAARLRGRG